MLNPFKWVYNYLNDKLMDEVIKKYDIKYGRPFESEWHRGTGYLLIWDKKKTWKKK